MKSLASRRSRKAPEFESVKKQERMTRDLVDRVERALAEAEKLILESRTKYEAIKGEDPDAA